MLHLVYTIQADAYALVILGIIYVNYKTRADLTNTSNKIFLLLVFLNAAILCLDIVLFVLDGAPGLYPRLVFSLSTCLFYILIPLPPLLWLAYTDYFIHRDRLRLKRYGVLASLPAVTIGLLSIASLFWDNFIFSIGSDNRYHRGPLFFIVAIICHLYILFTAFLLIYMRKKIRHEDLIPLLLCALPPYLASLLQVKLYGIAVLWPALTLSLLLLFVFIQSTLMNTDHLTELFNRREYDRYLSNLAQRRKKKYIAGIMMDLDYFKRINDLYGHSSGDTALVYLSEILRKSFRQNDFIARIGGDEFAVILELNEKSALDLLVKRLEDNILSFNDAYKVPYRLSVSIGFGLYNPQTDPSLFDFFQSLDSQMYEEKKKRSRSS